MKAINKKTLNITDGGFRIAWMIPIEAIGYTIMVPLVRMVGFFFATVIISTLVLSLGKVAAKAVAKDEAKYVLPAKYAYKADLAKAARKNIRKHRSPVFNRKHLPAQAV